MLVGTNAEFQGGSGGGEVIGVGCGFRVKSGGALSGRGVDEGTKGVVKTWA